jgi:hypothetical protein
MIIVAFANVRVLGVLIARYASCSPQTLGAGRSAEIKGATLTSGVCQGQIGEPVPAPGLFLMAAGQHRAS